MASSYYLVDGDGIRGEVLNVPYNGDYSRDFKDISLLDEATILMGKNIDEYLKEYNEKINMTNKYFNIQYPYKKVEMKTFLTVTNKDDRTSDLVNKLLPFTEERKFKVLKGEKVKLEFDERFARYILNLLFSMNRTERNRFVCYESMVSQTLKDLVRARYSDELYRLSFDEFFETFRGRIQGLFSSYTELRNIVMMLKYIKEEQTINPRSLLKAEANSNVHNIYTLENYKQELLKAKEEEERRLAEEEKKKQEEEGYYQFNLSDFFNMNDQPKKRGRVKDLLDC